MKTTIRVGNVSEIYPDEGMISVTYPQFDDATSGKLPLFSFTDEYKMPKVGDQVLVLHFENGAQEGVVLGHYWNKKNICPKAGKEHWWKSLSPPYADKPEKAYMYYDDDSETLTIHAPKIVIEAICDEHGEPGEILLEARGDGTPRIDLWAHGTTPEMTAKAEGEETALMDMKVEGEQSSQLDINVKSAVSSQAGLKIEGEETASLDVDIAGENGKTLLNSKKLNLTTDITTNTGEYTTPNDVVAQGKHLARCPQ